MKYLNKTCKVISHHTSLEYWICFEGNKDRCTYVYLEDVFLVEIWIHCCTHWSWRCMEITLVFIKLQQWMRNVIIALNENENMRITLMWETVTLRSELVKCHFNVCFVPNIFKCQLISPLTLKFSNCWEAFRCCCCN